MSRQVSSILEDLADAIDRLDLPVDSVALSEAFALVDRLNDANCLIDLSGFSRVNE